MASTVIRDLNARRIFLNISRQQLADKVHKDISTVNKQLDPNNGNMQLATLCEYAEALGGKIVFMSDDALLEMSSSDVSTMRMRMAELGQQNETLIKQVQHQERIIEEKDKRIAALRAVVVRKDEQIEEKDKAIVRKDKRLDDLYDRLLKLNG